MANNKLKTEELDKVLDSVSSEEQLQEYLDRYTNKDGYGFCQYFNEYLAEHDIVHAQVIADCNLDKDYATPPMERNGIPEETKLWHCASRQE